MADRFFSAALLSSEIIKLEGDEARHLSRVARREVGDVVEVFNGLGIGYRGEIQEIQRDWVAIRVTESVPDRVSPVDLTLGVAPPKGDRFDWIVEKATEIGVTRLVPLRCERSVVDPRSAKIERLRKVVIEASKQCGRNRLMSLEEPRTLSQFVATGGEAVRLIADQGGLPTADWSPITRRDRVFLAIGPEGGWTEAERRGAAEASWTTVGLGATRLRVETAAIVGAAIVFSRVNSEEGS